MRHFYNHLHLKEINQDIIYIATDYSMYTARAGSSVKLTVLLHYGVKARDDLTKRL